MTKRQAKIEAYAEVERLIGQWMFSATINDAITEKEFDKIDRAVAGIGLEMRRRRLRLERSETWK